MDVDESVRLLEDVIRFVGEHVLRKRPLRGSNRLVFLVLGGTAMIGLVKMYEAPPK
jgi:hypothetical protein